LGTHTHALIFSIKGLRQVIYLNRRALGDSGYGQPVTRFWTKVDKEGPIHPKVGQCWLWTAGRFGSGYAAFYVDGKTRRASRYSWELHYGLIPEGLYVLHRCDNRSCVNPDHLFLGDADDNAKDMLSKGRSGTGDKHGSKTKPWTILRGDNHGRAVVDSSTVLLMRQMFDTGKYKIVDLARHFGTSPGLTRQIVRRLIWRHI
jgi:hypothetical protein